MDNDMISGGTEQELHFEEGKTYLVENHYFTSKSYQEIYVERITQKAYKLRKERADGTWYIDWEQVNVFHERNNILECLGSPSILPPLNDNDYKVEINNPEYLKALTVPCPVCNGMGRVPDHSGTSGDKPCPKCFGSGLIYAVQ